MKILDYYLRLSKIDFIRKCFYFLECKINILKWVGKLRCYYFFKSFNIKLGKYVKVSGIAHNIRIGKNCNFFDNINFEFSEDCIFTIGNNCVVSYGVVISCRCSIMIGDNVQIGEYSSLRDSTHDYIDRGLPMAQNKDILGCIEIGNDVWIGRNCLILPGSKILDGTVVGANSIVKGCIGPNEIHGGCPLRKLKSR